MTTSALEAVDVRLEVEEKKETEAQSCFDRIWYSLSCSAKFDRVIMIPIYCFLSSSLNFFAIYQMQFRLKFVYLQNSVPSGDGITAAGGRNFDLL